MTSLRERLFLQIDFFRVVAFFHILLFAYWLGADLGVFLCGMAARRKGVTADAAVRLREVGALIDMAPRTCLVLMVPAGLSLASQYGSPLTGNWLIPVWIGAAAWLWLVWQVHWLQNRPLGRLFWKIDFAIRCFAMLGFLGFGGWCLMTGEPIGSKWLAAKIFLFGVIILLGIIIRILLLPAGRPPAPGKSAPPPNSRLRNVVFGIWGLVFVIAFLGVVKPF